MFLPLFECIHPPSVSLATCGQWSYYNPVQFYRTIHAFRTVTAAKCNSPLPPPLLSWPSSCSPTPDEASTTPMAPYLQVFRSGSYAEPRFGPHGKIHAWLPDGKPPREPWKPDGVWSIRRREMQLKIKVKFFYVRKIMLYTCASAHTAQRLSQLIGKIPQCHQFNTFRTRFRQLAQ